MAQLKDTVIHGGLEVENATVLDDSLEFKRTYVGADGVEVTHQHPVVNINNVTETGMGVVVESAGVRPLFLGSSEQAGAVCDSLPALDVDDTNLYLASGDSMRFYSGITTTGENANGLREAMRLNTSGDLVIYPDYADGEAYDAFQVRHLEDNENFVGSIRTAIAEENNARQVGLYTLSNNNYFAHELMIGVDDAGNRTVDVGAGDTAWREAIGANNASNITTGTLALARGGTGATTAAAARTNLGAAAKSWTTLGTVTGTNSATIDLTNYTEVLIVAYYSTTYISSVVLPKAMLSTSQKEVYFGGGWDETGYRRSCAKISTTKITGVRTNIDGTVITGNYRVYAR